MVEIIVEGFSLCIRVAQQKYNRPKIYNAKEAWPVEDVGQDIPWIFAVVNNR